MVIQFTGWGFTLVTVGFVVEGESDERLVNSDSFKNLLAEDYDLNVVKVINTNGNGNMCSRLIGTHVDRLKKQANPDKIIILADLDPEKCAPCITKRKEIIGNQRIDLIVIARKSMESWFLADTIAMQLWTKDQDFYEEYPEKTAKMPWDRLKEIALEKTGRGTGRCKINFARKFIKNYQFDIRRAADHPNCPSAKYFVEKLRLLTN
ncbi:MAG: hypothetical protein PHN45_12015 [Methylococcales bacterium]|nr:hypothetical protein [Methylococcales bacterium]